MNKIKLAVIICISVLCSTALAQDKSNTLGNQMWKNAHLNWTTYNTQHYSWNRFGLGSGYEQKFEFEQKLSWKIGIDLDWAKYTFFYTGEYAAINRKSQMRTTSLSFPLTINYQIFDELWSGLNLYTGPMYEQLFYVNPYSYFDAAAVQRAQFGWTVGAKYRFLGIFSVRLAYDHYFTGMFHNSDMHRSGWRFSLGF